jgi:hypothetical protein
MTKDLVNDAYAVLNTIEDELFGGGLGKGWWDYAPMNIERVALANMVANRISKELLNGDNVSMQVGFINADREEAFDAWQEAKKAIWDAWDKKMLEGK